MVLTVLVLLTIVSVVYMIVSTIKTSLLQNEIAMIIRRNNNIKVSPVTAEAWGYMQNKVDTIVKTVSDIDSKTISISELIKKVDSKV